MTDFQRFTAASQGKDKGQDFLNTLIHGKAVIGHMIDTQRDLDCLSRQLKLLKQDSTYFSIATDPLREKIIARREQLYNLANELRDINSKIQSWHQEEYQQ